MIQFNLLPDVKIDYLKTKRQKQMVNVISFIVAASAIGLLILFFSYVKIAQRKTLSDLNDDIKEYSSKLEETPDLTKVLTIQNQLNSLPKLLKERPLASRQFTYIGQLTPTNVTISTLTTDFAKTTLTVEGETDKLESVNKYVDTFKFTKYHYTETNPDTGEKTEFREPAFTKVVMTDFSRDNTQATYQITMSFNPVIFDITKDVKLEVPNSVTTRSQTEQPTQLFKSAPGSQ
jgi:hypothetical protein